MQASLIDECPLVTPFDGTRLGDLVAYTTQLIDSYAECRDKHNTLVKSLK